MKLISTWFSRKLIKFSIVLFFLLSFTRANAAPPVFWNVFDAKVRNNESVELSWLVTEYNNKSFWVQHSTDGITWKDLVTIPSKNSPESLEDYSFSHINRVSGKHYYRVKHMDVDSFNTGYSKVRAVMILQDEPKIVPNPATDHIMIDNIKGDYTHASIVDVFGKKLLQCSMNAEVKRIDIGMIPPGVYFVSLVRKNGSLSSQRLAIKL